MRGLAVAVVGSLLLAACSGDVQNTKLTPDLLENQAKVSSISNRLAPEDRPVFSRYLLSRQTSALPFGQPIQILTKDGKDPATVREALNLTRALMALEAERDATMKAAEAKRKALEERDPQWLTTSSGIAAYNETVKEYNGAIATFQKKLAEMQGRPPPTE